MTIRLNTPPSIENLRHYPAETVEKLRGLLASGVKALADRHRANFYDVVDGARVYFIHTSPATQKVMLLATWLNDSVPAGASAVRALPPQAEEFQTGAAPHRF